MGVDTSPAFILLFRTFSARQQCEIAPPVRESGFVLREARFFMRTCEPRVTRAHSEGHTHRSRVCVQVHARAYRCHNFASCLCLHHTCYGEHSCSCRLCMLPASQPAGITFQWSRCFQWFLTARARAHASPAFQSFANYRAELRKPTVHRALERDSASNNAILRSSDPLDLLPVWWHGELSRFPCKTIKRRIIPECVRQVSRESRNIYL